MFLGLFCFLYFGEGAEICPLMKVGYWVHKGPWIHRSLGKPGVLIMQGCVLKGGNRCFLLWRLGVGVADDLVTFVCSLWSQTSLKSPRMFIPAFPSLDFYLCFSLNRAHPYGRGHALYSANALCAIYMTETTPEPTLESILMEEMTCTLSWVSM